VGYRERHKYSGRPIRISIDENTNLEIHIIEY